MMKWNSNRRLGLIWDDDYDNDAQGRSLMLSPILFCTIVLYVKTTTCLVWWLARLTAIQEVPSSIPGYTLEIFLEV